MIEIISGWSYKIDDDQYILIHTYKHEKQDFKTRKPTGEFVDRTEEVGYFISLTKMLERLASILCKEKADAGEIRTIKEHIAELRKMREELRKLVA